MSQLIKYNKVPRFPRKDFCREKFLLFYLIVKSSVTISGAAECYEVMVFVTPYFTLKFKEITASLVMNYCTSETLL